MDLQATLQTLVDEQKKIIDRANSLSSELGKLNIQISEYNGAISITKKLMDDSKLEVADTIKEVDTAAATN